MACNYQNKIVSNGLVLCLDAADKKSYPGSGTIWFDRSGNGNNGTLVGGVGFSNSNGGLFDFDGVDDYISIPINLTNMAYTVIAIARYKGLVRNARIVSSNSGNWLMGWHSGQTNKYYAEGWVSSSGGGIAETAWICYAATGIPLTANPSGDSWQLYRNGALIVGPNADGSNGPNGIRLGNSGTFPGEISDCQVSFVLAYNRILTPEEIKQNFNAIRGRFGI
jgi:hypothetical protein